MEHSIYDFDKAIELNDGPKKLIQMYDMRAFAKFQNKQYKVIICSINAAGVGITLTSANHVILAECSWVPGLNQQAIDRVHRIGQDKTVYVDRIHCINSIDDFITKCEKSKSKMHLLLMRHAKANV